MSPENISSQDLPPVANQADAAKTPSAGVESSEKSTAADLPFDDLQFYSDAIRPSNILEAKEAYDRAVKRTQDERTFSFDQRSQSARGLVDKQPIKRQVIQQYLQTGQGV